MGHPQIANHQQIQEYFMANDFDHSFSGNYTRDLKMV
jgi:hypothetical protein